MALWGLLIFLASAVAGLLATLLVIRSSFAGHSVWQVEGEPQHVHSGSVPRAGGIGLGVAMLCGVAVASLAFRLEAFLWWLLLACAVPVFAVGAVEDFSSRVPPRVRYAASVMSAALVSVLAGVHLTRMDFGPVDWLLAFPLASYAITVFCIAGVSQAYNIVDGKNGLSSGLALVALTLIGAAALFAGDLPVGLFAFVSAGAVLGFLLLNYPRGLIFLGDGGAYVLGYCVAVLGVMLVERHGSITAWFPLLVAAYPILETLFSILRRRFVEHSRFDAPDHLHLHSLLYQLLCRRLAGRHLPLWLLNSLTAAPIVAVSGVVAWLGFVFRFEPELARMVAVGAVLAYLGAYAALRRTQLVHEESGARASSGAGARV